MNVLLCTINNISMVLEINIIKLSCILKTMSRNTIPEPQPDSASYIITKFMLNDPTSYSYGK